MKQLFLFAIALLGFTFYAKCQISVTSDNIKVILENDKMKVTEYASMPGKDICGIGKHSHPAHLTVCLTDAMGTVTTPDGITKDFSLKAGAAFWSEAGTHIALNTGKQPAVVYLMEVK